MSVRFDDLNKYYAIKLINVIELAKVFHYYVVIHDKERGSVSGLLTHTILSTEREVTLR